MVTANIIGSVNPDALARLGQLGLTSGSEGIDALAVMDTRLAAPRQRTVTWAQISTATSPDLPSALGGNPPGVVGSRVITHDEAHPSLAGSLELDLTVGGRSAAPGNLVVAAVSEFAHALGYVPISSQMLLPAVQQFQEDAFAATGYSARVLAFNDIFMQTDSTTTTTVRYHFDVSGDAFVVPTDVLFLWDDNVAGGEQGVLAAQLFLEHDGIIDSVLDLTGTPAEVSAQLQEFHDIVLTPPMIVAGLAGTSNLDLTLQYSLTSIDGSLVFFSNNSGLLASVPEPATATMAIGGLTVLACRRRAVSSALSSW